MENNIISKCLARPHCLVYGQKRPVTRPHADNDSLALRKLPVYVLGTSVRGRSAGPSVNIGRFSGKTFLQASAEPRLQVMVLNEAEKGCGADLLTRRPRGMESKTGYIRSNV